MAKKGVVVDGGVVFGGTAPVSTTKAFLPSGGVVFSGVATTQYIPAGNIFVYVASGGIIFSGAATTQFLPIIPLPRRRLFFVIGGGAGAPWPPAWLHRPWYPDPYAVKRPKPDDEDDEDDDEDGGVVVIESDEGEEETVLSTDEALPLPTAFRQSDLSFAVDLPTQHGYVARSWVVRSRPRRVHWETLKPIPVQRPDPWAAIREADDELLLLLW